MLFSHSMTKAHSVSTDRNISIANCIFTPTIATAGFFISFLLQLPRSLSGEQIYLVGGLGSLSAAIAGWVLGYRYRRSERLNLILRWLMMLLMAALIGIAAYLSFVDLRRAFG